MSKNITEEKIRQVLAKIKHPVIELKLGDLGIIKDVKLDADVLKITMAFPFIGKAAADVTIRDQILNNVREVGKKLDVKFELYQTEMTEGELNTFLAKERKTWNSIGT